MTTKVQEDLSYEEFKRVLDGIRQHNDRRMKAVNNGAPDPGPFQMPAWAQTPDNEDYSSLPQSTLQCFQANEGAHHKQLSVNQEVLQSVTNQRVDSDISQDEYEKKLLNIKNTNETIRKNNDDDLYNKLLEEGKKHPEQRQKILKASGTSGDFVTGIWATVSNKILEIVVKILKTIGEWVVGVISKVVNWFKDIFHF